MKTAREVYFARAPGAYSQNSVSFFSPFLNKNVSMKNTSKKDLKLT
jgi:hypothetical protein